MPELLIATRNAHKTEEISAMLGFSWKVSDLNSFPEIPSPDETGTTFVENAQIKAVSASVRFDGFVLADDSGLEVDALGGRPGVRSARFAGEEATDEQNRAKLLSELRAAPPDALRTARFRCALALAHNGRVVKTFLGAVEGVITQEEAGAGGFGYDCLFVPEGFQQTFAELAPEAKNAISHRGRALAAAREYLAEAVSPRSY